MEKGINAWVEVGGYFALVALLTLPFWIASSIVQIRLMPGLSLAAFAIVVPTLSACIMAAITGEGGGVRSLFAALRRPGRNMPGVGMVAIAVPLLVALVSWSFVGPEGPVFAAPVTLLAITPIFVLAAIAEEIGWSAFATERLARQIGIGASGIIVGLAWALWHIPSLIELGRPAEWIMWWSVWTLAQRVIMVQLYVRGGSWLWGPVLFHATSNIVWQAAPDAFDPRIEGLAMAIIAVAAAVWYGKTASAETGL